jgi:hypothetical protein
MHLFAQKPLLNSDPARVPQPIRIYTRVILRAVFYCPSLLYKVPICAKFLCIGLSIYLHVMSKTMCRSCKSTYNIPTDSQAARKVKDDHSKQCPSAFKNSKGFPVPFLDGKFCCPFRYNGCLFSAKINPIRKHSCSFGPVPGHTPQTVYGDAASFRPPELGQYIEITFADILSHAIKAASPPSVRANYLHHSSSQIVNCFRA